MDIVNNIGNVDNVNMINNLLKCPKCRKYLTSLIEEKISYVQNQNYNQNENNININNEYEINNSINFDPIPLEKYDNDNLINNEKEYLIFKKKIIYDATLDNHIKSI